MAFVTAYLTPSGGRRFRASWREANGKQKSQSFLKRADAKAHASKMENEVERRGVGDPEKHTVNRFFKRWIATLKQRDELSTTTLLGYEEKLTMLASHIGDIRLDKLSTRDLDEAYAKLLASGGKPRRKGEGPRPLSPTTVLHIHRIAHTCLEQARRWRLIPENPARDADKPSPGKSKARAFTEAEISRILEKAFTAEKEGMSYPGIDLVIIVVLAAGLRRSELLGLAFDCVDFAASTITIRRSVVYGLDKRPLLRDNRVKSDDSHRVISLDAETMTLLAVRKAWVAEQALNWGGAYQREPLLVFPGPAGYPYDPMAMTLRLRQILRQAKVKGQPTHGHRHSMATHLIAKGMDIKTVSSRLGHSSVSITLDLYAHAVDERDKAAATAMGSLISHAAQMQQAGTKEPENAA